MVTIEGGPVQCPVAIPRNDLKPNTAEIWLQYGVWEKARYVLQEVDRKGVHHYRYEPVPVRPEED